MNFYLMHRALPTVLLLGGIVLAYLVVTYPEYFEFMEVQQTSQSAVLTLIKAILKFARKNLIDRIVAYPKRFELVETQQGGQDLALTLLRTAKKFARKNLRYTSSKTTMVVALILILMGIVLVYSK